MKLLLILLLLTAPGWTKPPVQRPVNNPRPLRATGTTTGVPPKILIATGTVSTRSLNRLVLETSNGGKLNFLIDEKTNIGEAVKAGSRVVVNYNGTLESGVYRAVLVKAAPR